MTDLSELTRKKLESLPLFELKNIANEHDLKKYREFRDTKISEMRKADYIEYILSRRSRERSVSPSRQLTRKQPPRKGSESVPDPRGVRRSLSLAT